MAGDVVLFFPPPNEAEARTICWTFGVFGSALPGQQIMTCLVNLETGNTILPKDQSNTSPTEWVHS